MKEMLEIEVDENGNAKLNGNPIKVRPIDNPFVVVEDRTLRINYEKFTYHNSDEIRISFQKSLEQEWIPPKLADAYSWSGMDRSYIGLGPEKSFWAIQFYEIMKEVKGGNE